MSDTQYLKKMPPSDLVSEKAILGLIMMDEGRAKEILPLCKPEYFYSDKNKRILETMIVLASTETAIDLVTVSSKLDGVVSATYISSLLDGLPKNASVGTYLTSMMEKYRCRQIMEQCQRVMEKAVSGDYSTTIETLGGFNFEELKASVSQSLADKIRSWVEFQNGFFGVSSVYREFQIVSKQGMNDVRVVFHRMMKQGLIDRHPTRSGIYRRVENESELLDWINASDEEYRIVLPFELNQIVQILPRSVVCVAGIPNAGKTAALLEIVRLNMDRLKINYFTSELGPQKLRSRLKLFQNVPFPDGWKFTPWYRATNFSDAVKQSPDDLTIIDYIEQTADSYLIATAIRGVFDQLNKGVAVVAIQKKFGSDWGWGGQGTLQIPSLYLAIEGGWVKIVKAKEWREGVDNPNNKIRPFNLYHGSEFKMAGEWRTQDELDAVKVTHPWSPKKESKFKYGSIG